MCRLADPTAMVVESCAVPLPAFSPLLQRNYRYFFAFVTSTTLLCVFVFSMTAVYVKVLMDNAYTPNGQGRTVWQALAAAPMSVVLMAYTFVMVWFVGGLTAFHTYLMSSNQVSAAQGLCPAPQQSIMLAVLMAYTCVMESLIVGLTAFNNHLVRSIQVGTAQCSTQASGDAILYAKECIVL